MRRKTDAEFEAELEEGVEFLRERGCTSVAVVAKSFGGRLALTHLPGRVDRLVLWAPAAAFGESEEHPSITDTQRSIIEGELLGDACIYRRHETACHFKLESTTKAHPAHVRTHLPRGVFPNTQPYSLDRQTKWSDTTRWIIYSRGQTLFDELQTKWYEGAGDSKRKTVPESFDLDETALLHWYLGDDSLSERVNGAYRLHFSTHGFPEASVRRLPTQLDALGYDSYTSHASHVDNGSGLAIYISRESSQALLDRLADRNSIPAFDYKFSPTAE